MHQAIRGVIHPGMPDLPCGDKNNHPGGAQKEFDLRAATNRLKRASGNGNIPEREVEGGEQGKRTGDQLNRVAVIKTDAFAAG